VFSQENYQTILIEKRDGVAIATLNRPDRLNAVNGRMHSEIERLPGDLDRDPDVRAMLITGAGRAFCSGGDFGPGRDRANEPASPDRGRWLVDNLLDCRKPIVSAVRGYALGLGATLALLADVVVAGRSAVFGDTHVRMGIGAGDGGQVIWPLLVGVNRAKYYLMTGEHVPAEEAERIGLVNFVVDDDDLMDRATEIATRLAHGPMQAIIASKVPTNKYIKMVSNQVLPLSLALEGANMGTEDNLEAVRAFQEKREPVFTGG
jgi:enoyl-CoA hydratase/carnithine racemase